MCVRVCHSLGRVILNDVMVLRVEKGADLFVSVSGTPVPTAFGCSLSQLAARPEPMRSIPKSPVLTPGKYAVAAIPKEVYRLTDHLFTK